MSFLKEFKEDLSQAVNELIPEDKGTENFDENETINTLEEDDFDGDELEGLDTFFKNSEVFSNDLDMIANNLDEEELSVEEEIQDVEEISSKEKESMEKMPANESMIEGREGKTVSNESAVITKGTKINGDIESDGSLDIVGAVNGNVSCNGKLIVSGNINGNSSAFEIFANEAKIEGEVKSEGTVKIGLGTVIIGNVFATSAVIAGAVNGDIDVKGPVIVDASAVIMGNIKSKSVQINNGAVIEGFCSQSYSDINVKDFFESNKK